MRQISLTSLPTLATHQHVEAVIYFEGNIMLINTTITDLQRGLLFCNGSFDKVLMPGKHRHFSLGKTYTHTRYDITTIQGVEIDKKMNQLLALYPERFEAHLEIIETKADEIGLVYQNNQLVHLIVENQKTAYWKGIGCPTVNIINIKENPTLDQELGEAVMRLPNISKVQRIQVLEEQKVLITRQGLFEDILDAGIYYFWKTDDQFKAMNIDTHTAKHHCNSELLNFYKSHTEIMQTHAQLCETAINEIALVYQKGVLVDFVPPARQGLYWKGLTELQIEKQKVTLGAPLKRELLQQIENNTQGGAYDEILEYVELDIIQDQQTGFLFVNGKLTEQVGAGQYGWWNFDSTLEVKHLDLRLQNMEVNGQEILTKDRVNLRINLLADWKISDAPKVINELADHQAHLYRELQLALRTVVSTKTLDQLLDDKNLLNKDIMAIVSDKVKELGLTLRTVGVKDIILPGEMRDILGKVVEAQKIAEANLIKRREETQATRSLHNTAKVMEGNPTLLRLKEFEVLEKITQQIDTLNVYGGLEGVMNNMVNLAEKTPKQINKDR